MEAERSIVLQKKMILFLSLIIGVLIGIIYSREFKIKEKEVVISELDLVTVNVDEEENEIIRENIKYLANKVVQDNFELSKFDNDAIEAFAGDVTNLVDKKENEIVANNETTTNVIEDEVNVLEIINDNSGDTIKNVEETLEVKEEIVEQTKIETKEEAKETNVIKEEKITTKTVKYKDLAENNPPTEYKKVVEASATAYCLCKKCCGKTPDNPYYGYTHSGIKIIPGTGMKVIAVDPNVIPLNSKVYVEGLYGAWDYGNAVAADTGSAINNLKIDLYMDTHEEALEWGRKKVKVYVLE